MRGWFEVLRVVSAHISRLLRPFKWGRAAYDVGSEAGIQILEPIHNEVFVKIKIAL